MSISISVIEWRATSKYYYLMVQSLFMITSEMLELPSGGELHFSEVTFQISF